MPDNLTVVNPIHSYSSAHLTMDNECIFELSSCHLSQSLFIKIRIVCFIRISFSDNDNLDFPAMIL